MTGSRRTSLASLLAVLLLLTGCSSGSDQPRGEKSHGPASETAAPSPTATASDCPSAGTAVIPDGTWDGPITLDVNGVAGVAATKSSGSGQLHAVVKDGMVVQGTWKVSWHSVGHGALNGAEAKVWLDTDIAGTVHGPAAKPVVHGAWAISGTAKVTSPVTATVPIEASGEDSETMTVEATDCDAVTGTFIPSFSSKNAMATFAGTARWVGHRVD
jgi:hypothetical protein